jgi:hypothetical protein
MSNVIRIDLHRSEHNREITVAAGVRWRVQMTGDLWNSLDFLKSFEGVTEAELAIYALEEMVLQEISFDEAFRCCVAHLANRWVE